MPGWWQFRHFVILMIVLVALVAIGDNLTDKEPSYTRREYCAVESCW